jgi:trafficking protein particle complex subunit 4
VIEGESFKMNVFLTVTGLYHKSSCHIVSDPLTGTKFVLLTSLAETTADTVLQKIYDIYADAVMKNPFHTPEMPIRSERFDTRINSLIGTGQT